MPRVTRWTKSLIDAERASVRDALSRLKDDETRLNYTVGVISELKNETDSLSYLRRFLHVMYALMIHERQGGLKTREVAHLAEVASAILRIHGVEPRKSQLAFLYQDLHGTLSRISRKEGEFWASAWEQQVSFRLVPLASRADEGFQLLSAGIRAARLGFSDLSEQSFQRAEERAWNDRAFYQARLGRLRMLRLSGETKHAEILLESTSKLTNASSEERDELEWEGVCLRLREKKNLSELTEWLRRRKTSTPFSYFVDLKLWSYCVPTKPTDPYINRRGILSPSGPEEKKAARLCSSLETLYDADIPLSVRLDTAYSLLKKAKKSLTIERELLIWTAVTRWLHRAQFDSLAAFTLCEYRSLSLKLSGGKHDDALCIARDLLDSTWFREQTGQGGKTSPTGIQSLG